MGKMMLAGFFINLNKFFKKKHINKIISFMISDKKNDDKKINLITLKTIGKANILGQFNVNKVKQHCEKYLPKYMLPKYYIDFMDENFLKQKNK